MTSINDTTILAMLTRYPDMPTEEVDEHLSRIEHEENIAIGHALTGRIEVDDLPEDSRRTAMEMRRWSDDRTRRFRNEENTARERGEVSPRAKRFLELHEQGVVSDEFLIVYGMSGDLPDRTTMYEMSEAERVAMWEDRFRKRLGPNWRRRIERLPRFLCQIIEKNKVDWIREGF